MFEGELDSNDIALEFRVQKTYLDMRIDWVKLDPSRLLQVLINLTTNAIKFTSGQDKRIIVVSVGASSVRPNTTEADVSYFPSRLHRTDLTADEVEWGSGENIYLHFAVQDTGRGLDKSEKTLLFQRFRQASPRTHVQYGGSGLGLFISRELTELQGGEIGVASERGIGSTFAFYIKARRAEDMPQDTPIATSVNSLVRNSSNPSASSFAVENRRTSSGMPVYRSNTKSKVRRSSAISSPALLSATRLDYSKLKALIVEDNLVNQRVLQKQLRNIGFDTEVANHGGEALEVLKTSRYWNGREQDGIELAIILMDLEMPVMDGLTCARTIRNLERAGSIVKHVPIIAVTANVRLEQIEMAISAGMVCPPLSSIMSKLMRCRTMSSRNLSGSRS
jgi:CheY-like chemotaxis protein